MANVRVEYLNNIENLDAFAVGQAILDSDCNAGIVDAIIAERIGARAGIFRDGGFERFQGFAGSAIINVDGTRYVIFKF